MKKIAIYGLLSISGLLAENQQIPMGQSHKVIGLKYRILPKSSNVSVRQHIKKLAHAWFPRVLGDRPANVQAAVDKAFEQNRKIADKSSWLYKGDWPYYGLMGIDDEVLLAHIVEKNSDKQDIYIIDVGCAQGRWGEARALELLQHEVYKKSGKQFHVISLTGGTECEEQIIKQDNVTLYQFNQFKIENIDEELEKRGFDFKNKVDLIVSNWTLRHLVDPWGTLKRMYGLLTPQQGMLFSNGFFFKMNDDLIKYNDKDEIRAFPAENENILTHANAQVAGLFKIFDAGRDAGHFMLMRTDDKGLNIPLEYANKLHFIGSRWQNVSELVTVFNRGTNFTQIFDYERVDKDRKLYCAHNDQLCEKLYEYMVSHGLFEKK